MTKRTKMMIASAAVAGLITGAVPMRALAGNLADVKAGIQLADEDKGDKHDCKGKNDCKGKGGCKTDSNECKGKNDCKGKGGCNTNKPAKTDKKHKEKKS